jgi:hypothetical protein
VQIVAAALDRGLTDTGNSPAYAPVREGIAYA